MTILKLLKFVAAEVNCAAQSACIPTTETIADNVSRNQNRVILVGSFEITPSTPQDLNVRRSVMRPAEEFAGNRLVTGF